MCAGDRRKVRTCPATRRLRAVDLAATCQVTPEGYIYRNPRIAASDTQPRINLGPMSGAGPPRSVAVAASGSDESCRGVSDRSAGIASGVCRRGLAE